MRKSVGLWLLVGIIAGLGAGFFINDDIYLKINKNLDVFGEVTRKSVPAMLMRSTLKNSCMRGSTACSRRSTRTPFSTAKKRGKNRPYHTR